MNAVVTLASIPAVLAIVNLIKSVAPNLGRWSALIAVLLAVAVACGEAYLPGGVYQTLARGLILGLSAAGLYDVSRPAVDVVSARQIDAV